MPTYSFNDFFCLDRLAVTMISLVGFIGLIVVLFASRYMQGDRQYHRFLWQVGLLVLSVMVMTAANNLLVLLFAWLISNTLLISLMIHKPEWHAALNAGLLAAKTFVVGFLCLASAFVLLYIETRATSVQVILHQLNPHSTFSIMAMILVLLAAMTQSAIWPFHRWLLSSLNSPTPVSAIMHAGLVNGGGFLLVRFAPMYLANPKILDVIFALGIISALLGTLWKLMQHDVKRMLACSTMGQMGFMLAQIGLGLFPAAVAHLCWHGLFKANLFLSANSTAQENKIYINKELSLGQLFVAVMCGLISAYIFSRTIDTDWAVWDTTLVLIGITFITASQLSLSLLMDLSWQRLPIIIVITSTWAYLYGCSVHFMELAFNKMDLLHPQPLNALHILCLSLFLLMWLIMLFKKKIANVRKLSPYLSALYMQALNASQPHPSTITSYRNHYRYK